MSESDWKHNSSFSEITPSLQIAWDSTSLGLFKECPRKYFYSIVLGYQPREQSVHLTFGLIYHSALELYHKSKSLGASHAEATRASVRHALQATWNRELKRPWNSEHNLKNRFTLIRSIVWWIEQFGQEDGITTVIRSGGSAAVELSFRFETTYKAPDGSSFLLCGHLDRLGEFGGQLWGVDYKTTQYQVNSDYFFEQYSPDNQMSLYSFAGKVVFNSPLKGMIVDAAQILVGGTRFRRGFAPRTESQLDEWYQETGYYLRTAVAYAESKFWPMNDKSCGNYGGCPFRPICSKGPETRETWLKAGYSHRVWDPLKARGDI